ncbi:hypothetical protein AAVH_15254 [Aphelenchoides avenae]|nr:hypothetical protein AAVH_15254 [Aphelenchus avenae]
MAGKRSKKPSTNMVKKKPKIAIATRQQILSTGTLLDIFDACERFDFDNWNVVSRQYIQAIRRARPLRTVKEVALSYDGSKKVYKTAFFFKNPDEGEDGSLFVLRDSHSYEADHLAFFFKSLRFCYVDGPLNLGRWSISIDQEFVKCLKSIMGDFLFKDSLLTLGSYASDYRNLPTAEELLDALCSFPSLRALNKSTFEFVSPWRGPVDDGFLKSLASRGIFEVGNVTGPPREVANGIRGQGITEDGIIDYCFGDYDDGGKGRRLHITDPQLSPQFIPKLFATDGNV